MNSRSKKLRIERDKSIKQASCSCSHNMGEDDEDLLKEELGENLCCQVKGERSQHNQSSIDEDPFIECISTLQVAQEALEEEIKKFGEIGNGPFLSNDESWLSGHFGVEEINQVSSSSLELQVLSLTKNVYILESKSEELQGMLALKDSRIAELEKTLGGGKFRNEESTYNIGLLEEKFNEMESELESLFRQKVETEIEYLAITKMMQNLKVASAFVLLEKQETIFSNQVKVPNKLREVDNKDSMMKNRVDEVEKCCGEILGVEENFMMQKRVCKLTVFYLVQFMLLILVFWLFVSQLSPISVVVVPT